MSASSASPQVVAYHLLSRLKKVEVDVSSGKELPAEACIVLNRGINDILDSFRSKQANCPPEVAELCQLLAEACGADRARLARAEVRADPNVISHLMRDFTDVRPIISAPTAPTGALAPDCYARIRKPIAELAQIHEESLAERQRLAEDVAAAVNKTVDVLAQAIAEPEVPDAMARQIIDHVLTIQSSISFLGEVARADSAGQKFAESAALGQSILDALDSCGGEWSWPTFKAKISLLPGIAPPAINDKYVTLDQAAAMISRKKRTAEKWRTRPVNPMPEPNVEGGGGKPNEWLWSRIRPWLEKEGDRVLPEVFPY